MKKQTAGLGVLCLILVLNLGIGLHLHSQETQENNGQDVFDNIDALMEVIQVVRQFYVDEDMASTDKLFKGAIQGVMSTLDPFSNYLEGDQQMMLKEETEGAFGGIGIQTDFKKTYIVVIAPIDGTPAHEAGLKPGDMITHVDGKAIADIGFEKTLKLLRGKPGSQVTITYSREGFSEPRELILKRALIPIFSVTKPKVIDGYGYVRITQFMEKTADELKKVLMEKFSGPDIKGLIIDLRSNPGGLLHSAVEICSFFLPEKTFVVSVESRKHTQVHEAKGGYKYKDIPIVLLVNQGSASAAEIMSGCLKAHGRATLIGKKTYGKGSVQNVIPLSNGGDLKITIAHYFVQPKGTPNRKTIHKHGIEPDLEVSFTKEEEKQLDKAYRILERQMENPKLGEAEKVKLSNEFIETQEKQDKVVKEALNILKNHNGKVPPELVKKARQEQDSEDNAKEPDHKH